MHTASLNTITVTDPDALLDQTSVARILGTTTKFLEARRVRGGGPKFIRVGSLCRYSRADLAEWINSRRVSTTSEVVE